MLKDTDQIIEDATAARRALEALEDQLLADIKRIKRVAALAGRRLTKNKRRECDLLDSQLTDVYDAMRVVSLRSLRKIDNSDGIKALQTEFQTVNASLADDLERLKKADRYARTAVDVSEAFAKVATRIADLAV